MLDPAHLRTIVDDGLPRALGVRGVRGRADRAADQRTRDRSEAAIPGTRYRSAEHGAGHRAHRCARTGRRTAHDAHARLRRDVRPARVESRLLLRPHVALVAVAVEL